VKPRVLVVDDSLTVRMHMGEALDAAGFATVLCDDLRSARIALEAGGTDLVILDVVLPDGDGLDFLRELKSAPSSSHIPVLLLSTEAEVRSRVRGMGAGADEYVGKPYEIVQVIARARTLVHASAARAGSTRADTAARRILVIDDSPTFRHELTSALEEAGFDVQQADTGEEGLALAAAIRPDAVVVDGMLPGIDGATVVRRLKSDMAFRGTPCLLLTAAEGSAEELRSLEAGADAYIRKGGDLDVILVRLTALLRGASALSGTTKPSLFGPKRLLAVDDSATYLNELGSQLRLEGYDVVLATSGEEALEFLAAQTVDCILLDLVMPGLSGQETCRRIKQTPAWRETPLVILTAHDDRAAMIDGINAGADDYIAKSADFEVLKARLRAQLRRKHFEDENRSIRDQLVRKEAELRFQRLIHSNIIGVVFGDLHGRLIDANAAFLSMLGYSRDELETGMLTANVLTPAEWAQRDAIAMEEVRGAGSATPYEKEFFRKNGTILPVVLGLVLLEGADTIVGFVLDRTEQKFAEQEMRKYAAALEGANRELESFSYSVAHDLRAPLRSVEGFSAALFEEYNDALDADGQQYLRHIREAASHMSELIEDLLMLSRVTSGDLRREPADLSGVARGAVVRLRRAQPERKVTVTVQDGLLADADARLLGAVFDNLIGNSWKFTSKRDDARIEVGSVWDGAGLMYFVRDNGAGFDMAFAHKLFGVFQRLHMATEFEGTGVGLATVQRIIHRHGGRVWAEGAVGEGATFYFTLNDTRNA
jgi:PAS domain S-box-containing protein